MQNKEPRNDKGEPHGFWYTYIYNNVINYYGEYVNGKRHGKWTWYTGITPEENEIWVTATFFNNKRIGLMTTYHKRKIYSEIFFAN